MLLRYSLFLLGNFEHIMEFVFVFYEWMVLKFGFIGFFVFLVEFLMKSSKIFD